MQGRLARLERARSSCNGVYPLPSFQEGPDVDANLQLLCSSCNSVKNARTLEQLRDATKARGTHVSLSEGG